MDVFNEALINANIEKQNKKAKTKAIKSCTNDLIEQGIDKEIAKVMAKSYFQCGMIKTM